MRAILLASVFLGGCIVGETGGTGPGPDPDPDPNPEERVCPLPETGGDAGTLSALKAQQCNVPGSQGALKFYRLSATLAETGDVVQLELYDNRGAFTGGVVAVGTYPLAGPELDFATCGVCLRALGNKGLADEAEYFAIGGSVEITAIG